MDPLAYLFGLEQFGIKFGLDNIRAILARLGHPELAFRTIHVAGTNGKGSVTAMTDACLRAAGHRSGRYTSPHLVDVCERFAVDGVPVSREALASVVAAIRDAVAELRASGALLAEPTFFEVTTAAAFELFRRAGIEVAVVEVGLGGRLDATNVIRPLVTAITSIAFDHEQYLGRTLADIAVEKGGIVKPGVPVVVGALPREADAVIAGIAADRGAPFVRACDGASVERSGERGIRLRTPDCDYGSMPFALEGEHQLQNALVAVRMLELAGRAGLSAPPAAVAAGLGQVAWPGRLDWRRLPDGREALLDAAHNAEGAAALAGYLGARGIRCPLVFAAMRDKDARAMLGALAPHATALVLTQPPTARAADPAELAQLARTIAPELPAVVELVPRDALRAAWRLSPTIVVAGSIFLLGDVLPAIESGRP
ncbi:MAG: bifunctional folylpolyglutamate synthase/dihydrofolate synthase [Betaproteobacteria bacterium]